MFAVGAQYFPHAHVGVVHGHAAGSDGLELEAEQLTGHPEHAFAQLFQLQVRLHRTAVVGVARGAHLLGVVAVVPRRDGDLRAAGSRFGIRQLLHVRYFFMHAGHSRLPHRFHQFDGALRRLRHGVFQAPVRVRGVAQQLRTFKAQLQDAGDERVVVVGISVVAAVDELAPHFLAQVAAGGAFEERLDAGARVGNGPLACLARIGSGVGVSLHQ